MSIKNIGLVLGVIGTLGACKSESPDSKISQLELIAQEHRERCISAIENNKIEGLSCAAESYAVRCVLGENATDHIIWRNEIADANGMQNYMNKGVWLCDTGKGVSITEGPGNTVASSLPSEFVQHIQDSKGEPHLEGEEFLDAQMQVLKDRFGLACTSSQAVNNGIPQNIVDQRDEIMKDNPDIYDLRMHAKWLCTNQQGYAGASYEGPEKLGYIAPETPLALEVLEQAKREFPGKSGDDDFIAQHALEILRWRYLSPICKGESNDSMYPIFDARDHISTKYFGYETRWQC